MGDVVQHGVGHDVEIVPGMGSGRTVVVSSIYTAWGIWRNGRRGSMHGS